MIGPGASEHGEPAGGEDALGQKTLGKVAWRLLPFLCLLYVFNILDRANVGFARLTMQDDLKMSPAAFDVGFGLFYIGYLLFEVPSNLLLRRLGARRWIARIMISWGIITCLTMFVTDVRTFYLVRFLLGVAEAGFFPGIILYLTFWFPARERARATAYFMVAIALAGVISNPISGAIMEYLHLAAGFKGWQWLFLLEGLPSVLLGFTVLYGLTDRPDDALWLTPAERGWLVERLRREEQDRVQRHQADRLGAMLDRRVWLLIGLYFTVAVGSNAGGAYLPMLIKNRFQDRSLGAAHLLVEGMAAQANAPAGGLMGPAVQLLVAARASELNEYSLKPGTFQIGLLSALPHLCALIAMTLFSAHSDRTGERRGHVAVAALTAGVGWSISALASSPWLALLGFCLAQTGMMCMLPTFWTLPTAFLSGAAAAGGIALINSVANIGGFFGPTILGQLGLWSMASTLVVGAVLALCVRPEKSRNKGFRGQDSGVSED
jgi:MFS transporter, ACS family, tartrate transporter